MRCPECNQRNSVAAKRCAECNGALRRKPLPLALKIFIGAVLGLAVVFWLATLTSAINNPEKALTSTASNLTGRSKSAEQMMGNIKHFDQAMREFLRKYGSLGGNELATKLSTCLPKSLYENHIFDILPNLKLVEIDTALNASNYLILLDNGKIEVLPIIGLDVYDSNSFLPRNEKIDNNKKAGEGQLLVLLGHTANHHAHQPRVKVLLLSSTVQSDSVFDLTDNTVPKIYGEGSAKFSPNQKDIEFSISLFSRGQELNIFANDQLKASLPVENELLYEQLIWQNNSYTLRSQPGTSKLYALFAVGSALKNHNKLSRFHSYFSNNAVRTIEQSVSNKCEEGFTISSAKGGKKQSSNNVYVLKNDCIKAIVELRPMTLGKKNSNSTAWFVNSISVSKIAPNLVSVKTANNTEIKTLTVAQETIAPSVDAKTAKPQDVKEVDSKLESKKVAPSPQKTNSPIEDKKILEPSVQKIEQASQASFVQGLSANVKVRSGPGTSFDSIYEISPNKRIAIIGKDNGWYRVKVDDKEGYIYAGLIKNQRNSPYKSTIIKQSCNVRDDERHIITGVRSGEHLILIGGLKNNHYKVMLSDGKIGYVTREAIDGVPVESPPPSVP